MSTLSGVIMTLMGSKPTGQSEMARPAALRKPLTVSDEENAEKSMLSCSPYRAGREPLDGVEDGEEGGEEEILLFGASSSLSLGGEADGDRVGELASASSWLDDLLGLASSSEPCPPCPPLVVGAAETAPLVAAVVTAAPAPSPLLADPPVCCHTTTASRTQTATMSTAIETQTKGDSLAVVLVVRERFGGAWSSESEASDESRRESSELDE